MRSKHQLKRINWILHRMEALSKEGYSEANMAEYHTLGRELRELWPMELDPLESIHRQYTDALFQEELSCG